MSTASTAENAATNAATMLAQCGRVVMWFGTDTRGWTLAQHADAARNLAAWGVDSACVKVADGTVRWLDDAGVQALRQTYLNAGVGFIPFTYCYGNGVSSVAGEAAIVRALFAAGMPVVQVDMEAEYNGHPDWAAEFASAVASAPGLLSLSTWADPHEQNWDAVLRTLAPVCNAQTPQEYTNYLAGLAAREFDPSIYTCIQPGIDLTQEFGANDQASIVRAGLLKGQKTFYLWYYDAALKNPDLVHLLVSMIRSAEPGQGTVTPSPSPSPVPAPPPAPTPQPAPTGLRSYTVQAGDTLSSIGGRLNVNWHTLYQLNMATIEAAARAHGHPDSNGGALIFPGTVLHYQG